MNIENQLFLGDCIEIMRGFPDQSVNVVITDPPWPDGKADIQGKGDCWELWARATREIGRITRCLVVVLSCMSDVRFLATVPSSLPFFRVCWMKYVPCRYKGSILYTSDIAYIFGRPILNNGQRVFPGETTKVSTGNNGGNPHPCFRPLEHMRWLIKNFSRPGELCLDPFMGSGQTLLAAKLEGRKYCGIEIEEKFYIYAKQQIEHHQTQGVLI